MIDRFQKHVEENFPFLKDKKLLLAISGGVDSVVIAYLLNNLNYHVSLAHCNFKLRGKESDLDEVFVEKLGKVLDFKTYTTQFDTTSYAKNKKISIQVAARELRYDWFEQLRVDNAYDFIITAHHANDTIETILINLARGTGLEGLTGIPMINNYVVRPLLSFSSDEILKYAKSKNIIWREDASNSETKYLRNKIRHKVIPILEEINPNYINSFTKTTTFLKQSKEIIEEAVDQKKKELLSFEKDTIKLDIAKLLGLSSPKAYLYYLLKDYGVYEWNDVYALLHAQSGKVLSTKSHILLKDRDFLLILPVDKINNIESQCFNISEDLSNISTPINLSFKKVLKTKSLKKNTIYVDKNLLNYPLALRKWSEGDFFYPKGMLGKKKLSKYFKDEKISLIEKQSIWILCDGNDDIIWIIGKRQDRRFLPSTKTTEILRIKYKPL